MATRIHVIAAYDCPAEDFKQALGMPADAELHEANGWSWVLSSVWTTKSKEVASALQSLPGPCLWATTQDDDRWFLRLYADGQEPFTICHEFSYIGAEADDDAFFEDHDDFLPDDEDELGGALIELGPPAYPKGPAGGVAALLQDEWFDPDDEEDLDDEDGLDDEEFDGSMSPVAELIELLEDFGLPVPEDKAEAFLELPPEEGIDAFFLWQAGELHAALNRFGIPHDADALTQIITGEGVSEAELETGLGNLPRLLEHLGFGEYFSAWLAELEHDTGEEEEDFEEGDLHEVSWMHELTQAEIGELQPLAGGPVSLDASEAYLIGYLAFFCDPAIFGLFVAAHGFPEDAEIEGLAKSHPFTAGGSTAYLGCPGGDAMTNLRGRKRITPFFDALPDGTQLEFRAAADFSPGSEQRYAGVMANGAWHVAETFPTMTSETLTGALALARWAEGSGPLTAASDEELRAVRESGEINSQFGEERPQIEGSEIVVEQWQRRWLAQTVFRHRYANTWDIAAKLEKEREAAAGVEDFAEKFNASLLRYASDEVVLAGASGAIFKADEEAISKEAPLKAVLDALGQENDQLKTLGFEFLGIIVHEHSAFIPLVCYAHADGAAFLVRYLTGPEAMMDVFTPLEGNASLTTSSAAFAQGSCRRLGILFKKQTGACAATLWDLHREGLDRLSSRGVLPEQSAPTLEGLATRIDAFMAKRLGLEPAA